MLNDLQSFADAQDLEVSCRRWKNETYDSKISQLRENRIIIIAY
jgi:hypothetical protein